MKPRRVIAVDFDGVLHPNHPVPWSPGQIEPPNPAMEHAQQWVDGMVNAGWTVVVHTARLAEHDVLRLAPSSSAVPSPFFVERMHAALAVQQWLHNNIGGSWNFDQGPRQVWLYGGKPWADVYLDDKAVRFTGSFPQVDEMEDLLPHNNKSIETACFEVRIEGELLEVHPEKEVRDLASRARRLADRVLAGDAVKLAGDAVKS